MDDAPFLRGLLCALTEESLGIFDLRTLLKQIAR